MGDKLRRAVKALKENRKRLKTAALIIAVTAALLIFGHNGKTDEIEIYGADGKAAGADTELSEESATGSGRGSESESDASSDSEEADAETKIDLTSFYVDISGEVKKPGVYKAAEGMRIFNVVELAGGFTDKADLSSINQAELIFDGEKIVIPAKNAEGAQGTGNVSQAAGSSGRAAASAGNNIGQSGNSISGGGNSMSQNGQININTADSETLQQIPGVGPVTAQKIIDYRSQNGRFRTKEDIKNISGIGDKTYAKMESKICV